MTPYPSRGDRVHVLTAPATACCPCSIVVAIPEGLPLAVTISLAYSMRKMMQVRTLTCVHSLMPLRLRSRKSAVAVLSSFATPITTLSHAVVKRDTDVSSLSPHISFEVQSVTMALLLGRCLVI